MPPSTFRDQRAKLESLGFLVLGKGNMLHFYEDPKRATQSQTTGAVLNENLSAPADPLTAHVQESPPENIQIYIDKNKVINIPEE